MGIMGIMKEEERLKILLYSEQIAWLGRLLHHRQISESEYQKIKREIMKSYQIQSDLTATKGFAVCKTHDPEQPTVLTAL